MEGHQWKSVASGFLFLWMENLVPCIKCLCMSCVVQEYDLLNHCDLSLALKLKCMLCVHQLTLKNNH